MIELVDTHAHIHFDDYGLDPDVVLREARAAGVTRVICVGTTLADSQKAVEFASSREGVWATVGIHPHEAATFLSDSSIRREFTTLCERLDLSQREKPSVLVAIGEVGLDYYYEHSPRSKQKELLEFQLELAHKNGLPVIFHVREAFDDFWSIVDLFPGLQGVVHSFSASTAELEQVLSRGFYAGLNGIMTFTKDPLQLEAAKAVPRNRLLLETDAPYLTPAPYRGKVCKSEHVRVTAEFLAGLRGESLEELTNATTANARRLFNI